MYLKIGKKKIKIEIRTSFWKRLKGYMFVFDPIQVGLCYPKCKSIHTYLMCQRIDVVMTDKNFKILYLYPDLKSEKVIFPKKNVYYTFELPLNCCEKLEVGAKLNVIFDEKEKEMLSIGSSESLGMNQR